MGRSGAWVSADSLVRKICVCMHAGACVRVRLCARLCLRREPLRSVESLNPHPPGARACACVGLCVRA